MTGTRQRAGAARDVLLHPRHHLQRQLEPEVAARHHHRVADAQDLVERRDRLRTFQLGDQRHVGSACVAQRRPCLAQVAGAQHEAHRHEIDAGTDAERQVGLVLVGETGRRQRHAGRVDPLVLAEHAAVHHPGADLLGIAVEDLQLDSPVVEQKRVARLHQRRQVFVAGGDASGSAEEVADGNHQVVAGGQRDRRVVAQQPGADLRAAEVLQQRHAAAGLGRQRTDARHHLAVRVVGSVREVEAEDVDAGGDQIAQRRFAARRRADRRDDLRASHGGSHCTATPLAFSLAPLAYKP